MDATLKLFFQGQVIFSSRGRWLYPLFELEKFLEDNCYAPAELTAGRKRI